MPRWKKTHIAGNEKPVDAYQSDGYLICLNNNQGRKGPGVQDKYGQYWQYEVTCQNGNGIEYYIGETPTLPGAKKLAREHEKNV